MQIKPIRNANDFVIGGALLAVGCYVLFTDNILYGNVPVTSGGPLVHPAAYVRLLGGILAFLALFLMVKSLNWRRAAEALPFRFFITSHITLTVIALMLYTFLLSRIGFAVSTFVLNFFLCCLFLHRERTGVGKPPLTKKDIIRTLIIVTIYSILLLIVIYILFTKVLYVDLP